MYDILKHIGLNYIKTTKVLDNKDLFYFSVIDIKKANKYVAHMKSKGLFTVYFRAPEKLHVEFTILWYGKIINETLKYVESIRINKLKRILK